MRKNVIANILKKRLLIWKQDIKEAREEKNGEVSWHEHVRFRD